METWWIGETISPLRALLFLAVAYVLNLGCVTWAGFRRQEPGGLHRLADALEATALAVVAAAAFVLQAMACGVPVVARAVGSAADAVADGVTGLLVPSAAAEVLADAVRGILSDHVRRESFGLAAVDRARARFNWNIAAAATGRIIDEITAVGRVVALPRQDSIELPRSPIAGG